MRSVTGFVAACIAATAMVYGGCAFAQGADSAGPAHYLFFSGFDLWRAGGFAHGGVLWSPHGLEQDGFTLKVLLAGGTYRYKAGTTDIDGRMGLATAMPGWRFKGEHSEVLVYGGPEVQLHRLAPDDFGNDLRGRHFGLRVGADIWFQPTDLAMVTLSTSTSTVGANIWARAAFGWRILDRAWIGPEISAIGDNTYRQVRVGAHLTGLRTLASEWSLGAGYTEDSEHRSGGYGHIGVLMRR